MSLLRRRGMMEKYQKQEENVIYVDSGFLEIKKIDASTALSTAFSEPTYNGKYPDASSSTAFGVNYGDVIHLEASTQRKNQRIRYYREDGSYINFDYVDSENLPVNLIGAKYARVLLIATGDIESLAVTRNEDKETVNYKIIDRR